jgi:thioesterase domain-containing protein
LFLHALSSALGVDQPFYAFQPQGVDGGPIERTTVEEMAKHYIAEMRKVQPDGPYFIGGYCFGGNVAFEMARQLGEQGCPAGVVAMLSAPLRFHRPEGERTYLPEWSSKSAAPRAKARGFHRMKLALRWRAQRGFYTVRTAAHKLGCRLLNAAGIPVPQSWRELYIVRSLLIAERNYVPRFFNGKLMIFRGGGIYDHDPGMGWSKLAAEIDDFVIGTAEEQKTRRDILNEPLVQQVAEVLNKAMDVAVKKRGKAAAAAEVKPIGDRRPQDAA